MRRSSLSIRAIALFATLSAAAAAASAQEPTILVGLHAGVPTKASVAIGTGRSVAGGRLLFMMFEPGVAGGRASVGLADLRRRPAPLLRATWLRTWGRPSGAGSNRNYLGPELQLLGRYGLGVRGGLLFPVGGAPGPAASFGLSFGF